jgi:hypothetical protein
MTPGGLPHSEIPGLTLASSYPRLIAATLRPSSALGAKASTVRPYQLDLPIHTFQRSSRPCRDERKGSTSALGPGRARLCSPDMYYKEDPSRHRR